MFAEIGQNVRKNAVHTFVPLAYFFNDIFCIRIHSETGNIKFSVINNCKMLNLLFVHTLYTAT